MWIFKIFRTLEVVKMETRRGKLHWPFEEIRLKTFRSGRADRLWGEEKGKNGEELESKRSSKWKGKKIDECCGRHLER